jgi:hypothetical protein
MTSRMVVPTRYRTTANSGARSATAIAKDVQPDRDPTLPGNSSQRSLGDVIDQQGRLPRNVEDEQAEHERGGQKVDAVEQNSGRGICSGQVRDHDVRREGQESDEEQQQKVQGISNGVRTLHELGRCGVDDPETAYEREADVVAEELRPLLA